MSGRNNVESCWETGVSKESKGSEEVKVDDRKVSTVLKLSRWVAERNEAKGDRGDL